MIGGFPVWYLMAASVMFYEAQVLATWFHARVLAIVNKPLYWALMLAFMFATPLVRAGSPAVVTLVANFALLAVPIILARDSLARRVAVVAFVTIFNVICDIALMLIWAALVGGDQTNIGYVGEHPLEFGLATLGRLVVCLPLLIGAARLIDRHFPCQVDQAELDVERSDAMTLLAWFPFLQMFLIATAFFVISYQCSSDYRLLLCLVLAAALCAVIDFVLLRMCVKAQRARQEELLAEQLEAQLAECLSSWEQTLEQVESTARLRHDLRNQVQIVAELARRGEFERAQHYLQAMIDEVRSASEGATAADAVPAAAAE